MILVHDGDSFAVHSDIFAINAFIDPADEYGCELYNLSILSPDRLLNCCIYCGSLLHIIMQVVELEREMG